MTFDSSTLALNSTATKALPRTAHWAQPQRVFPILVLIFGIPLAFLTAPFQSPDEPAHFFRAYQISEGSLRPVYREHRGGGELPASLSEVADRFKHLRLNPHAKISRGEINEAFHVPLDEHRRQFIEFVSSIYSPAPYIPQSIAICLGRHLGFGPLSLMYAGRLGNLLFWAALSYLALRITPTCGRPLLLLLVMPMTLFQAASLSADPTTNCLAVLFTVMVLRYANVGGVNGKQHESHRGQGVPRVGVGMYIAFAAVTMLLALAKFAYVPLLALLLLIPPACFGGVKRYFVAVGILGLLNIGALMAWTAQTQGLDTIVHERRGVSPAGQAQYLRDHPSMLWTITRSTIANKGSAIVRSFVGRLGWLDIPMSFWFSDAYLIAMAAACWLQEERWGFRRDLLLAIVLIPVTISTLAIAVLNYMYTQPVGFGTIGGIQGRYLIPLAPAIIVLLWGLTRRLPRHSSPDTSMMIDIGVTAVGCFSGIYTLIVVWSRYYGQAGHG